MQTVITASNSWNQKHNQGGTEGSVDLGTEGWVREDKNVRATWNFGS